MRKILILLLLTTSISCQKNIKVDVKVTDTEAKIDDVVEVPVKNEFTFLENITELKTPLIDSTNFDNFSSNKVLNKSQLQLIQIEKIAENPEKVVANYRLNLSDDFKTFVFTYNKGEMELFSTLVNYSNDFQFISKLDISYDEIAESWFRKESQINKKEIVVNDLSYTEEIEKSIKTVYTILENGQIVKK